MIEKGIIAAAAAVQALITLEAVVEMIEGVEVSRMTGNILDLPVKCYFIMQTEVTCYCGQCLTC